MKQFFSGVFVLFVVFLLYGCGNPMPDSGYAVELPELPQAWRELLGSPLWRVEWLNEEGRKVSATIRGGGSLSISPPGNIATAVSAGPYWPARGIGPGVFKAAGAIVPFDISGSSLVLSWRGGVDAALFWELAGAYGSSASPPAASVARLPWNFNWPRFRELFDDPALNAEIRADPWLADWHGIAAKIIRSGFDKRRLVPEARSSLSVPAAGPGPWIGTSPFAEPLLFKAAPEFPVRSAVDTWVSGEGIIRCNTNSWIFIAY